MRDNIVENIIIFNGGGWNPPDACHIIPEVEGVGIGWKIVDGVWEAPPPSPEDEEQAQEGGN